MKVLNTQKDYCCIIRTPNKFNFIALDFVGAQFYLRQPIEKAKSDRTEPKVNVRLKNNCKHWFFKDISIRSFWNETFLVSGSWMKLVWISKIRYLLKDNFHISENTLSVKVFRRICWEHGVLLNINSVTDA